MSLCINVLFWGIDIFCSSGCGSFLVLSGARKQPPRTPRRTPVPWSSSKSPVTTGRRSEHVEPSNSIQIDVPGIS